MPLVKNLKNELDCLSATTQNSKIFKRLLLEAFDKRFMTIESKKLLATSTMLDPRYKKMYFNCNLACSRIINKIAEEIVALEVNSNESQTTQTLKNNSETQDSAQSSEKFGGKETNENVFWNLDRKLREKIKLEKAKNLHDRTGMPEVLRYYLSEEPIDKEEDPIKYWSRLQNSSLSEIALKYLTVIATSVPVERLFSQAKCILTDKRNQLTPTNFQVLLFLKMLPKEYYRLD